jgi:hypothetical protein
LKLKKSGKGNVAGAVGAIEQLEIGPPVLTTLIEGDVAVGKEYCLGVMEILGAELVAAVTTEPAFFFAQELTIKSGTIRVKPIAACAQSLQKRIN